MVLTRVWIASFRYYNIHWSLCCLTFNIFTDKTSLNIAGIGEKYTIFTIMTAALGSWLWQVY